MSVMSRAKFWLVILLACTFGELLIGNADRAGVAAVGAIVIWALMPSTP
jgi:hypothetical protein